MQLIFVSGLSTAATVTELAGRGIGMDVVRSEIAAIGGRIEIASTRGQGTTFTIYLPLTLAVTQAVWCAPAAACSRCPAAMVEQVLRLKADALAEPLRGARRSSSRSAAIRCTACAQLIGARSPPRRRPTTRCCCCAAACSASRCTSTS